MQPSKYTKTEKKQKERSQRRDKHHGEQSGRRHRSNGSTDSKNDRKSRHKKPILWPDNSKTKETSFLDRLHDVAAMIASSEKKDGGMFANYLEPPLPLISEKKFSMQPDLAHGWKPDAQSLTKIPSLSQFKSPYERFEDRINAQSKTNQKKAKQKKLDDRQDMLSKMMLESSAANQINNGKGDDIELVLNLEQNEHSDSSNSNEDDDEIKSKRKSMIADSKERRKEGDDNSQAQKPSPLVGHSDLRAHEGDSSNKSQREADNNPQQSQMLVRQHLQLDQEPEQEPLTPKSSSSEQSLGPKMISQKNESHSSITKKSVKQQMLATRTTQKNQTTNSLFDQVRAIQSLANEDLELETLEQNKGQMYKKVQIKNTERFPEAVKVPLLANTYNQWITDTYINRSEDYQLVYKKSIFKNSQDLLYHNLKEQPDPLIPRVDSTKITSKTFDLIGGGKASNYNFNLGTANGLPGTKNDEINKDLTQQGELLSFDSEFECGNLERAYFSKKPSMDEDQDDSDSQKYVLLVQNDYNTNGHQQWFNFKVSNLQEDMEYNFEMGPFKKSSSKFQEGMLPWVCDITKDSDPFEDEIPRHTNLANKYITSVSYTTKKLEDGTSMSFLSFSLFIERQGVDYNNNRTFLIAYSEPYSYTRLLTLLKQLETKGLAQKAKWLNFKVGRLCQSLGGTPIPLLKISKRQNESVLSVYQKPIVLVSARVHPGEPPGSFLCEGFMRAILNKQNERLVEKLLAIVEIVIVPMLNPDGVIIGNNRVNLGGVDMNRRWGSKVMEPTVTPEVHMLKEFMIRHQNQILMYLDMHGHTKGEGIFFYACQPELPKPNPTDQSVDLTVLEKSVLVQALPTALGKTSQYYNLNQNRYFTVQKDKVGKKLNTARCVSAQELGIDLSYTIESSFYSYPFADKYGNKKQGLMTETTFLKAGAELLIAVYNLTFTTQKLQAMNKTLLQFLQQKRMRMPGIAIVKQDPFLENQRPLFKQIFSQVKQKFAKVMQNRLQKQIEQSGEEGRTQKPLNSDISFKEQTSIERFQDKDEQQMGNVQVVDNLNRDESRKKLQLGYFARSKIPLLNKQRSSMSLQSADQDDDQHAVFSSTLGVDPSSVSLPKATLQLGYQTIKTSEKGNQSPGRGTQQKELLLQSPKNQTMSNLPYYSRDMIITKSKFDHDQFNNVGSGNPPSTEVSQASGSDSDPSVDNMEQHVLLELQVLIKDQKVHLEQKRQKQKMQQGRRNKNDSFIESLRNFEQNGLKKVTVESLRKSIEEAIQGDARSKSQLAEIQTKNHDNTLFNLNNQMAITNQFVPNIGVISNRNTKRARRNDMRNQQNTQQLDKSQSMISMASQTQRNERAFRLTERMSSIYSKAFIPTNDPKFHLENQQARIDEILETRTRNFEVNKSLIQPSSSVNLQPMNATGRPHAQKAINERKVYSVLPQNQFKIQQVFGGGDTTKTGTYRNTKNNMTVQSVQQKDQSKHLPQITARGIQAQMISITANNTRQAEQEAAAVAAQQLLQDASNRSQSLMTQYEQKQQQAAISSMTLENLTQSEVPTYWKVLPPTKGNLMKGEQKSVLSLPLENLIEQNSQAKLSTEDGDLTHTQKISALKKERSKNSSQFKLKRSSMHDAIKPQHQLDNQRLIGERRSSQPEMQVQQTNKILKQMHIYPTGQRPNNKGIVLTSQNMTSMHLIQQLAFANQAHRSNQASKVKIKMQPKQKDQSNPRNISQKKQKIVRRVIKVNQAVANRDQLNDFTSGMRAQIDSGNTQDSQLFSNQITTNERLDTVRNLPAQSFESFGNDIIETSYAAYLGQASPQYLSPGLSPRRLKKSKSPKQIKTPKPRD